MDRPLDGLVNATIRAQVTGYLLKQHASYCVPQLRYPFILCMCLALQDARRSRPSPTPTPPADTTYGVPQRVSDHESGVPCDYAEALNHFFQHVYRQT